jgi:sugar lactone lactonase YvrE
MQTTVPLPYSLPGGDGTLYITDSGLRAGAQGFEPAGTDAVYRFGPDGSPVALASGSDLTSLNGVAVDGQAVMIAPFGGKEIYRIDPSGARTSVATLPAGQLDGLIRLPDGSLLVSSWEASSVYRVSAAGEVQTLASGVESPADIGYDARRNRVLIPLFMQNRVEVRPVR